MLDATIESSAEIREVRKQRTETVEAFVVRIQQGKVEKLHSNIANWEFSPIMHPCQAARDVRFNSEDSFLIIPAAYGCRALEREAAKRALLLMLFALGILLLASLVTAQVSYSVESFQITVYRDGLVHVKKGLSVNVTEPSISVRMLAPSVANVVVVD